jgi:hypothetical protein
LGGSLGTSAVIYVPAAALDAYKGAPGWEDYGNQLEAMP